MTARVDYIERSGIGANAFYGKSYTSDYLFYYKLKKGKSPLYAGKTAIDSS